MLRHMKSIVALALIGLLAAAPAVEARCRLLGRRHQRCCQAEKCPPIPPAPAPGGYICPKFYFAEIGGLHLHYGGPPYCGPFNPPTQRMFLTNKYCTPFACSCDPADPNSHCEPVTFSAQADNGIAPEGPGESFYPPKMFKDHLETKAMFKDKEGTPYYVRLYRVKLPAYLVLGTGKKVDYIGFQVNKDETFPLNEKAELELTVGKRAKVKLTEGSAKGEYEIVLFKDDKGATEAR